MNSPAGRRDQAGRRVHHVRMADTAAARGLAADLVLDLPELVGEALVGLVLAAIVGTVKLIAFLIRKLITAGKPQP